MRRHVKSAVLLMALVAVPAAAAAGDPQRDSSKVPPGLGKMLTNATPGFLVALIATEGSNSRLQDLPVSP